jgi:hypothetical protein
MLRAIIDLRFVISCQNVSGISCSLQYLIDENNKTDLTHTHCCAASEFIIATNVRLSVIHVNAALIAILTMKENNFLSPLFDLMDVCRARFQRKRLFASGRPPGG